MGYRFTKILSNTRGSTVVDYLMMTAMVAGVMVPILFKFGGEKFIGGLFGQREKFVAFLAQNRKETVPDSWFSEEKVPTAVDKEPQVTGDDPDIQVGETTTADNITTGNTTVGNAEDKSKVTVGEARDNSRISVGNPGSGGSTGTGGGGAGGAGGGLGSGNSDGFFASKNGSSGEGSGSERTKGADSSIYAQDKGGAKSEEDDGEDFNEQGEQKAEKKGEGGASKGDSTTADSRKRAQDNLRLAEQELERKRSQFDWWLLIKILIILLILFVATLIALSNLKRR